MTVPAVPAGECRALALSAAGVLLTRLPWLGHDYGSDPDSYRVVSTARALLHGDAYEPSRLPGYPAYEYLSVLTAAGPPWTSNLVTALFSAVAFVLMALMLRSLNVRHYLLLAVGFAMVPVIYLSSCCTMDYLPSMTLALGSVYAVCRRRPALGGLLLGLATGCRITAAALALPLCVWMWLAWDWRRALKASLVFGSVALLVAAVCFLPVWRIYGFGFFTFFDNDGYPLLDTVVSRATTLVWGPVGWVALALLWCAIPLYWRHTRQMLRLPSQRHMLIMALLSAALYLAAFLRLPDEPGYLVPLVPWVLIAAAIVAPAWMSAVLAMALIVSPWVSFEHARPGLAGPIIEDHRVRESQDAATGAVIAAVAALPGRAAIVCGWVLPRILLALRGDTLGAHQFIYLVEDEDDYRRYLNDGRQIYYLPGVDLYESQAHQLELADLGAHQLDVPRERQRPASTGE